MKYFDETFVWAWQVSGCVTEVAVRTRMEPDEVLELAAWMRENGVELKEMPRPNLPAPVWPELFVGNDAALICDAQAAEQAMLRLRGARPGDRPFGHPDEGNLFFD